MEDTKFPLEYKKLNVVANEDSHNNVNLKEIPPGFN